MAYLSRRMNKNGAIYLYACEDFVDPQTKKRAKKQLYLGSLRHGVVDFNDNAINFAELFIGTEYEQQYWQWRKYKETREVGLGAGEELFSRSQIQDCIDRAAGIELVCSSQCKRLKLYDKLSMVFSDEELLSNLLALVYFCACGMRSPLYQAANWSRDQLLPTDNCMSEGTISKVLSSITAEHILQFQSLWLKEFPKGERMSLDITSVSSYARSISDVLWGYNRDKENLPQINLLMVVSQSRKLPVWFEILPGAIGDVTTVESTVKLLKQIDDSPLDLVLDRGFASAFNFSILLSRGFKFTCGIPIARNTSYLDEAQKLYNESKEFLHPNNLIDDLEFNGFPICAVTKLRNIEGHRVYDHFYYTDALSGKNNGEITKLVKQVYDKLKAGETITDPLEEYFAENCFEVKTTPKRGLTVKVLTDEIEAMHKAVAGFFVLRTNKFKLPKEALEVYMLRDGVEKRFDDLKNAEDMKRLRVHSDHNMRSRIFIQFLAQILRSDALTHLEASTKRNSRVKTVTDIYASMNCLRMVKFGQHNAFYKYPTKDQKYVLDLFEIDTTGPKWSKNLNAKKS